MKKLITLVLVGLSVTANARQITHDEATRVASDFMKSSELRTPQSANAILKPMKAPGVDANSTVSPYYVFNRGENDGFVIISGDDRAPKILGYSDKGSFEAENLPPQLKAMMESWARQIEGISGGEIHSTWTNTMTTRAEDEVLLETANWGQDFPYNAGCPIEEGANCVTGCVATAMAIVMRYHNWPETYDWSSMPLNTENDPLDYEIYNPALATLMADAGEAVNMEYHPWESGANMNWVGHKMQQKFKYSPDCQFITSAHFEDSEWLELLKSNIESGNPVIYTGSGTGNHAFVIDGYNSIGYHVNWGWDGNFNGYFAIDALTPNEYEDFSQRTGMVLNIVPDKSGAEYSECFVDACYFWRADGLIEKINVNVKDIVSDSTFDIITNQINFPPNFDGEIGIALVDDKNIIKEVIGSKELSNGDILDVRRFGFSDIKIKSDITSSDRIQLVSKNANDDNYKLILGTIEVPSYISVKDNTPKMSTVKFNVEKNINLKGYWSVWGDASYFDYQDIPEGESEYQVLTGMTLFYHCAPVDDMYGRMVVLSISGKAIYGDMIIADQSIGYSLDMEEGDYIFIAKLPELKDENVNLTHAGTLQDLIHLDDCISVRDLKISGKMNALDFWYIRDNMPCIRTLDLKDVTIEAVTASDGNFVMDDRDFQDNEIPDWALPNLHSANVETLILPDNLTSICSDALVHLKVQSLTIPEGVNSIGVNVFYGNHNLNCIEMLNPEPVPVNSCIFVDTQCPENGVLYVPEGSAEKYREAPVWQDFKEIIEGRMPVKVRMVELSRESWSGEEGESFKIEATVIPENATDKTLEWVSSDESVATVDGEGNVSVLNEGMCVITVRATDGSGVSAECIITSISGVDSIFNVEEQIDIFDMNGILIKKNSDREYLKVLPPGVYLMRQGSQVKKMIIR